MGMLGRAEWGVALMPMVGGEVRARTFPQARRSCCMGPHGTPSKVHAIHLSLPLQRKHISEFKAGTAYQHFNKPSSTLLAPLACFRSFCHTNIGACAAY